LSPPFSLAELPRLPVSPSTFTYDTSGDSNSIATYAPYLSGQLQTAVNYVTQRVSADFTNNATVISRLAESTPAWVKRKTYLWYGYDYASVANALLAHTPSDSADLPLSEPPAGSFAVSFALAKALGLQPASGTRTACITSIRTLATRSIRRESSGAGRIRFHWRGRT